MSRNEERGREGQSLRGRVDGLEETVAQQERTVLWLKALLQREREETRRDRRRRSEPPCCNCDDGVLRKERGQLVCTSCNYLRHL